MASNQDRSESIKLVATIIIAICNMLFLPLAAWTMSNVVELKVDVARLNTWRGDGTRYSEEQASKDLGLVIERVNINASGVNINASGVKENSLAIRQLERERK